MDDRKRQAHSMTATDQSAFQVRLMLGVSQSSTASTVVAYTRGAAGRQPARLDRITPRWARAEYGCDIVDAF